MSRHRNGENAVQQVVPREQVAQQGQATDEPAWMDYLAATRRLEAVRAAATVAAHQQAQGVQAALGELTEVRARLARQRFRLRGLGVPEEELAPTSREVEAAALAMAGNPEAAFAALGRISTTMESADAELRAAGAASGFVPTGSGLHRWLRHPTVFVGLAAAGFAVVAVLVALMILALQIAG